MHQKGVYTYPFPNFIGVAPLSNIGVPPSLVSLPELVL